MNNHPAAYCRPLSFETLEARIPLAGEIIVKVSGGILKVTGDAGDNQITIEQTDVGKFTITAKDGENFRLNGAAPVPGPINVAEITKDIKVDLKAGDDKITVQGQGIANIMARNVDLKTGQGSDNVLVSIGKLTGKLSIDSGARDLSDDGDNVSVNNVDIAKTLSIKTGKGGDSVDLRSGNVTGNATIKTGTEDDAVKVHLLQKLGKNLTINTGSAFEGSDDVEISANVVVIGNLAITTGNGDDSIDLDFLTAKKVTIKTGAGDDNVTLAATEPVTIDQALITLSSGEDDVAIGDPLGGLNILTLNGPKKSKITGGKGDDTITGKANIAPASLALLTDPLKTSIENFP